jgi:hypothetical protein
MRVVLLLFLPDVCGAAPLPPSRVVLLLSDACGVAPSPPPGCAGCCSSSSSTRGSSSSSMCHVATPLGAWQTGGENEDNAPNRMLRLHFWITGRPWSKMGEAYGVVVGDVF